MMGISSGWISGDPLRRFFYAPHFFVPRSQRSVGEGRERDAFSGSVLGEDHKALSC